MKKTILLILLLLMLPTAVFAQGQAFGMNIHLRQRIPEADWDTVMAKAANAGVQWGREEFNWDVIEPSDDSFSWGKYDSVVNLYEENGIKMVGLLTYSSDWASSNPGSYDAGFYPPDLTAWKDYVGHVAERYYGHVTYWEIWNEPNHSGFWKGSLEEYAQTLSAAATAIKKVNPNAKIVLGGLSGSDSDYLDRLYEELDDPSVIDVVAIHPYRLLGSNFNYSPEESEDGLNTLTTDLYNIKAVVNKHDKDTTPIWLTESGWHSSDSGVSNKKQARYLMRFYTIALSIPQVRKVFWYTLVNSSSDKAAPEANFGILNYDYSKKASYNAYRFVKKNLNRRQFKSQKLPRQQVVDDFYVSRGWRLEGAQCTTGAVDDNYRGKRLKVTYAFTSSGNCYTPVVLNKQLPEKTRALQFRLKGSNDDTTLRVRVTDATGETFQYTLGFMPQEWLYYTIQLNSHHDHWGGNNDDKLDQPLSFNAFILDDTDGSRASGTVLVDDLTASKVANTYLFRFRKGRKNQWAFWTTSRARKRIVQLANDKRVRVKRFRKSNFVKVSSIALYRLKAAQAIKFIKAL